MGVLQHGMVVCLQPLAILVWPVGAYFQFEPFYYLFKEFGLGNGAAQPLCIIVLRLIMCWICIVETMRTAALIVNPLLMEHCVYNKVVKHIRQCRATPHTILLYVQLSVIQFAGNEMISYACLVLFGALFF